MAGLTKKGILIVLLTMIIFAPVFAGAQTYKSEALQSGYHSTLYTELIASAYQGSSFVSIREPKLIIGTDVSGQFLVIERTAGSNGAFQIYPQAGNKNLILTTKALNDNSGSIMIYPAFGDAIQGNVILAHSGSSSRGKVGIGTSNPQYTLDVAGNAKISGPLYLTDPSQTCTSGQCLTTGTNGALSCAPCSGGTGGGTYTATSPINISNAGVIFLNNYGITETKLANSAVTYSKIATNTIMNVHLRDEIVSSSKLSNFSITSNKINSSAVTNSKIEDNAITTEKIYDDAVTLSKIDVEELAVGYCPANGAVLIYNASTGRLRWNQTVSCTSINLQLDFSNHVCYPAGEGPYAQVSWSGAGVVINSIVWNVTKTTSVGGSYYDSHVSSSPYNSPEYWSITDTPLPLVPGQEYTFNVKVTVGRSVPGGTIYYTQTRSFCTVRHPLPQ